MHLSQIALFVAPLIAIVTAIVPNAAAMGTLAKKECLLPAQTCDPKKPQECCDNECKEAIPGSDTTCGVSCPHPRMLYCVLTLNVRVVTSH